MTEIRDCKQRLTAIIIIEETGKIEICYKRQRTLFFLTVGNCLIIERDGIITEVLRKTVLDYEISSYTKAA